MFGRHTFASDAVCIFMKSEAWCPAPYPFSSASFVTVWRNTSHERQSLPRTSAPTVILPDVCIRNPAAYIPLSFCGAGLRATTGLRRTPLCNCNLDNAAVKQDMLDGHCCFTTCWACGRHGPLVQVRFVFYAPALRALCLCIAQAS